MFFSAKFLAAMSMLHLWICHWFSDNYMDCHMLGSHINFNKLPCKCKNIFTKIVFKEFLCYKYLEPYDINVKLIKINVKLMLIFVYVVFMCINWCSIYVCMSMYVHHVYEVWVCSAFLCAVHTVYVCMYVCVICV